MERTTLTTAQMESLTGQCARAAALLRDLRRAAHAWHWVALNGGLLALLRAHDRLDA